MDATQQMYDMILNLMAPQFQYSSYTKSLQGLTSKSETECAGGSHTGSLTKNIWQHVYMHVIHSGFSSLLHKDAVMVHLCPVSWSNITNILLSVLFRKWQQIGMWALQVQMNLDSAHGARRSSSRWHQLKSEDSGWMLDSGGGAHE